MNQMRILAYGKGEVLVESVSSVARAAGIKVVKKTCPHFSAGLFSRANYLPKHALVSCSVTKVE